MSINIMASWIIQREDLNGHYEGSLFTPDLQISKSGTGVKKLPAGIRNTVEGFEWALFCCWKEMLEIIQELWMSIFVLQS